MPQVEKQALRVWAVCRLGALLFLRDFRMRYRQTYLGYLWAAGRVLFAGGPLIIVGAAFDLGGGRTPGSYVVFALTGFILWQVFWDSVVYPQWIARRMRRLIATQRFSYHAVLVAAACYVGFNASLYLLVVVAAFVIFQAPVPLTALLGLLAVPALAFAGMAVGMVFVPLTFVYLDFRYGLPMMSPVLLWTAPIFYESPNSGFLHTLNTWNPISYLIPIPRQWIVDGSGDRDWVFLVSLVAFACCFTLTQRFYRRAIPIGVERLNHG